MRRPRKHVSGSHQFKALLNIFPRAQKEDYMRDGVWDKEMLEIDYELIRAHRREAERLGAGQVSPLELRRLAIEGWSAQKGRSAQKRPRR